MTFDRDEIVHTLGRVEGKLDMLISANANMVAKCDTCDVRFKKIEKDSTQLKSFVWVVSVLATFLGAERLAKVFHLPF